MATEETRPGPTQKSVTYFVGTAATIDLHKPKITLTSIMS